MILVQAFEGSKYKVKDCTNEPFVGINVTTDKEGNYYMDPSNAWTNASHSDSILGGPHQRKSSLWNMTRIGIPSIHLQKNFSKAVDVIVLKLGYKNTPYDPKFFCKWIDGMPILVMFHSDDFRWCGPPNMLSEWDALVQAFEGSKYKVKDCTNEPFDVLSLVLS